MNSARFLITLLVLCFPLTKIDAEQVVTVDDCLELSLSVSGPARNAAIDEAIAGAQVIQARSIALPHFSAEATYSRLDELQEIDIGEETTRLGTLDNYSATLSVNQLLFAGGKVGAALRAAGLTRSYASFARQEVNSVIQYETVELFNNILLAQESVKVLESSLSLLSELVKQTETMMDHGKAAEFDVLTAQVRFENERPQLIRANNTLAVLKEFLRKLTGLEGEFTLKGELEYRETQVEADDLIVLALRERSLLRSYELAAQLREEDVTSARSDLIPSIGAFFAYNGANSYGFVAFGEDEWEWHWSAGLSLNWNIWDGALTRGILKEKRLAHSRSLVDLDEMQKSVSLDIRSALLDLKHAAQSVEAAASNIARAEKAMQIMKTRHEAGMATYLDFTDANVSLKTAKLLHLTAVRDHMNAAARLKKAVGCDFNMYLNKTKDNGESHE